MKNKRKVLSVEINESMEQLLQERIEYLQAKNPHTKITKSDAVRHAICHTGYKREKNKRTDLD